MPYAAGDVKWGTPTLGTTGGVVTWEADYYSGLSTVGGFTEADFDAALTSAFDSWEDVASIDFVQVPFGSGADVTVTTENFSGGIAGIATYSFDGNPGLSSILSGKIEFNSNLDWSPNGGFGGADFGAVALHEIGHILGLGHVNDATEIMNPTVFTDSLGSGDIAGAQYLYGRDASDAPQVNGEQNINLATDPDGGVSGGGGDSGGGAGVLVGLLLGLLGLLLGGIGAGVAMAAASVPGGDDDEDGDGTDTADADHSGHDHSDHTTIDENGLYVHSHAVYLPGLPGIDVENTLSPCGCHVACACHLESEELDIFA